MRRIASLALCPWLGLVLTACPRQGESPEGRVARDTPPAAGDGGPRERRQDTDGSKTEQRTAAPKDLECGALLTSAEVGQACGLTDAPMQIQTMEGVDPKATCARSFALSDGARFNFVLADHQTAQAATALPWSERREPLSIGDGAGRYIKQQAEQFDWHTVEVRRGRYIVYLREIVATGEPTSCAPREVESLAEQLAARL